MRSQPALTRSNHPETSSGTIPSRSESERKKRSPIRRCCRAPFRSSITVMDRTIWVIIAVVAISVAGFFGYRAHQASEKQKAHLARNSQLEAELEASRMAERDAARLADQEAEARRLSGLKAQQETEAEARRLAQSAAELEAQEMARIQAEEAAQRAATELERIRSEKALLEAEARRLREQRELEAAEAARNLEEAQMALEEMERRKNAEINRQAELIAAYSREPTPSPVVSESEEELRRRSRIVFPANYKRAAHTYVLLPELEDE